MDIIKLYNMQKALDGRIIEKHGLRGVYLLANTVLALQVELAEMINEWRGFKHWSKDREPRRAKMLTEASDCLHFYLSIARQLGVPAEKLIIRDYQVDKEDTSEALTELFLTIGKIALASKHDNQIKFFRASWNLFFNILEQRLQIYPDDLYQAYIDKTQRTI